MYEQVSLRTTETRAGETSFDSVAVWGHAWRCGETQQEYSASAGCTMLELGQEAEFKQDSAPWSYPR